MIFCLLFLLLFGNERQKSDPFVGNFNLEQKKEKFGFFLEKNVITNKESFSFLSRSERVSFSHDSYAKISESFFSNCKTEDTGLNGNGGAIFYENYADINSRIDIERTCFAKCHAYSSGGAVYIIAHTVFQLSLLFSECYATSGQCFSIFATKSFTAMTKIEKCGYNKNTQKLQTFGGSYHVCEKNNVTKNKVDGKGAFIFVHWFDYVNISGCIFAKNIGKDGFNFIDEKKKVLIENSLVYGNSFKETTIYTHSVVEITGCWYEIMKSNITNKEASHLISFENCIFNSKEYEMKAFLNSEKIKNPKYGVIVLPLFPDISPLCWKGMIDKSSFQPENKNWKKVILIVIFGSVSAACAIYLYNNMNIFPSKRKAYALEGKYYARV